MALRKLAFLLAASCAFSSAAVHAEQLAVEGVYAAQTDSARGISEISIEPIRGREGFALEDALASQLGSAQINGEPFFRIVRPTFDEQSPEYSAAQLSGFARSRIYDLEDGTFERTRCVREEVVIKDDKKKKVCVERVTDIYECRRLYVEFRPEVALFAGEETLYRREDNLATSERYCADSSFVPSADAMMDQMIARFARAVRLDLAPEQRFERFRIFESRKGLTGEDRKAFKHAIKLTKSDPVGACMEFEDILTRNPFHRSALYNVALCREADGQLELAAEAYDQLILASDKSDFLRGRTRVESRFRAQEQLASLDQPQLAFASLETRASALDGPVE